MQKLQFRHSIYGPKIFEICGKTSIYNKYITRLSFIGWDVPALYMAKVFPNCLSQMPQVREISIKLHEAKFPDSCMNLSKCQNIEKLHLDFGMRSYESFQLMVKQCFNAYSDLQLPKIFKERNDFIEFDDSPIWLKEPEEEKVIHPDPYAGLSDEVRELA
jgi:hypothetical protein